MGTGTFSWRAAQLPGPGGKFCHSRTPGGLLGLQPWGQRDNAHSLSPSHSPCLHGLSNVLLIAPAPPLGSSFFPLPCPESKKTFHPTDHPALWRWSREAAPASLLLEPVPTSHAPPPHVLCTKQKQLPKTHKKLYFPIS